MSQYEPLHFVRGERAPAQAAGVTPVKPLQLVWGALTFFAVAIGAYGVAVMAGLVPNDFLTRFDDVRTQANLHFLGGAAALLLGPWQFSPRLRRRFLGAHRWMGRLYLVAVFCGGLGGLYLAPRAHGGLPSALGFGLLGVLWLVTAWLAYFTIRSGDVASHRRWMLRNFAHTYAAVMLRVYLPAADGLGFGFDQAYPVIAWICWVPNLILIEAWLRRGAGAPAAPSGVRVQGA